MPPVITEQDFKDRIGRMNMDLTPAEQALYEWLKAELADIKARLTAGSL